MLDTGYGSTELAEVWIFSNEPGMSFNIQHPACRGEALKERRLGSRIT